MDIVLGVVVVLALFGLVDTVFQLFFGKAREIGLLRAILLIGVFTGANADEYDDWL